MKLTKDDLGSVFESYCNEYPHAFIKFEQTPEIIEAILKNQEEAELCQQLIKILINHCGETGKNEGAVETLNRIIEDAEKLREYQTMLGFAITPCSDDVDRVVQDAENWRGYMKMCDSGIIHEDDIYKLIQLKERLKKLIEEQKEYRNFDSLYYELQKILGEKNAS